MAAPSFARVGYNNAVGQWTPTNTRAQDVYDTKGISTEVHQTSQEIHLTAEQAIRIANALQEAMLGAPNGVASLGPNGQLAASQIPASVAGGLGYQGRFNPSTGLDGTGTAIPAPSASNKGFFWIASADAEWIPPGNSEPIQFNIGDWIVSSGTVYDRIGSTAIDTVARQLAQDALTAANTAQSTANAASTAASSAAQAASAAMDEAQLLDAAFCEDEADMASKNLRPGAVVLMAVTNDAVDSE